jgi:hypothetical protein
LAEDQQHHPRRKAQIICPIIKAGDLANDFTSVSDYGIIPEWLVRALTWMLFFG